jgi:hypothetical protein
MTCLNEDGSDFGICERSPRIGIRQPGDLHQVALQS